MKIVKIEEVRLNPKNPRIIKDAKFKKLVESLRGFPEMANVRPIVVNTEMVVLGGNMRLKAMIEAKWENVPIVVVDWSKEKQDEFVIKDNLSYGEWDYEALADWDRENLEFWGLEIPKEEKEVYTAKVESPIYLPKEEKPKIEELFNKKRYGELIEKINESDLEEKEKEFLRMAATRFIEFNFGKIAEFYSHSRKEVQELMEDSALVIIDYNKAIELGFVKLYGEISDLSDEDGAI